MDILRKIFHFKHANRAQMCVCFFSLRQLDRVAQHRGNLDPGTMGTREFPPNGGETVREPRNSTPKYPKHSQDCKNCLVPWIFSLNTLSSRIMVVFTGTARRNDTVFGNPKGSGLGIETS